MWEFVFTNSSKRIMTEKIGAGSTGKPATGEMHNGLYYLWMRGDSGPGTEDLYW